MKKILLFLLVLGIGGAGYLAYLYTTAQGVQNVYSFIPEDFIFLIESDKPVQDWKELSQSAFWKNLKKSEYFADITQSANKLDSLLSENPKISEMAKIGKLLISTHLVGKENYDFLIGLDLDDNGKLANFKAILTPVFRTMGYKVTHSTIYNFEVTHLYDAKEKTTLHFAFIQNVLLASYSEPLLKSGIMHHEKPSIQEDVHFSETYKQSVNQGAYSLMVNYKFTDRFIRLFTAAPSESLMGLGESLSFSGFTLHTSPSSADLDGYSATWDTATTYINAFKNAGKGSVHADEVLPKQTVMFTSVGFTDFKTFFRSLQEVYKKGKEQEYEDMMKTKKQLEGYLKINIEEDFLGWVKEEMTAAVVAVPQLDGSIIYTNYALLHFPKSDYAHVKDRLDFIDKQIKKKTPLKFETVVHNGHEIHYLEMKGLFKLFFKKLFAKIEKPHYVILDNFVVFSNDIPSLQFLIDAYMDDNVLVKDSEYSAFRKNLDAQSNVFVYLRNENCFDYIKTTLDAEAKADFQKNHIAFQSLPHIGFQLIPAGTGMMKNRLYCAVKEWKKPVVIAPPAADIPPPAEATFPDTANTLNN